jgi:hypothetical protein
VHNINNSYLILFSQGPRSGHGHYSRAKIIEKYINDNIKVPVKKVCIDDKEFLKKDITEIIQKRIEQKKIKILILDLNDFYLKPFLKIKKMLLDINKKGILTIGIDSLRYFYKYLNYVWIPSPYKENILKAKNIIYGWDKMIFNRYKFPYISNKKIVFLLGASKNILVSKYLPTLIEKQISKEYELHWVLGEFSEKPKNINPRRWIFHKGLDNVSSLLKKTGFVFSLYGLSSFEAVSSGIPTVSYCTKNNYKKNYQEIIFFKKKEICFIETDLNQAVIKLFHLINSRKISLKFSNKGKRIFSNFDLSFLKKI